MLTRYWRQNQYLNAIKREIDSNILKFKTLILSDRTDNNFSNSAVYHYHHKGKIWSRRFFYYILNCALLALISDLVAATSPVLEVFPVEGDFENRATFQQDPYMCFIVFC